MSATSSNSDVVTLVASARNIPQPLASLTPPEKEHELKTIPSNR